MQRPTCKKCGGRNTFLDVPRFHPEQVSLGCVTCGWRLYGEEEIQAYVVQYNKRLEQEEAKIAAQQAEAKRLKALNLKRERDRMYWARTKEQRKRKKEQKREQVYIIPDMNTVFRAGEMDSILKVRWAEPLPNKEGEALSPCAWPPCEQRARANSKYCSRKCTVRVAHKRAQLRKKGELKESGDGLPIDVNSCAKDVVTTVARHI